MIVCDKIQAVQCIQKLKEMILVLKLHKAVVVPITLVVHG